jgi:predicted metalloendopeptidase
MAATVLQARYVRSMNSLYIPAALIQPPFFDGAAGPAVNFGGIGVLAAHELTHGFDALGSKYDEHGNVRDWWSADDRKEFAEATSCEVAQYSEAVPKSGASLAPSLLVAGEPRWGPRYCLRLFIEKLRAGRTSRQRPGAVSGREKSVPGP